MSLLRMLGVVISSVAVVVVPTGCGGSNSEGVDSATTTATATVGGGGNERFSVASWSVYTSDAAEAKRVNSAALTTFKKCRVLASNGAPASQFQSCIGDSLQTVVTEGQKLLELLQGFEGEVAGACASALTELEGFTKVYIASVNTLQSAITGGGVGGHTGFTTQLDDSQQSLARAVAAQAAFEAACKPT